MVYNRFVLANVANTNAFQLHLTAIRQYLTTAAEGIFLKWYMSQY